MKKALSCILLTIILLLPSTAPSQGDKTPEQIRQAAYAACSQLNSCIRRARSARTTSITSCSGGQWLSDVCKGSGVAGTLLGVPLAGQVCNNTIAILRWSCRFDAEDVYRADKRQCCTPYRQERSFWGWSPSACGQHYTC